MKISRRHAALVLLLGATLLAAFFAPEAESEQTVVVPASVKDRAAALRRKLPREEPLADALIDSTPPAVRPSAHRGADHQAAAQEVSSLFSTKNWQAAAAKESALAVARAPAVAPLQLVGPPRPAPQQPVVVPPLPFRSLGWYQDGVRRGVFLVHNGNNLVVHVGDKVGNDYIVESWTERTLSVRYVPLNQVQTLEVGSYEN